MRKHLFNNFTTKQNRTLDLAVGFVDFLDVWFRRVSEKSRVVLRLLTWKFKWMLLGGLELRRRMRRRQVVHLTVQYSSRFML